MSDNRRMPRTKKRLSCTLIADDQRTAGIVLDVSATGLFVQTSATILPGAKVELEIQLPEGTTLLLHTSVMRRRTVPPQLRSVARGGLGLAVEGTPEEYYKLIGDLQGPRETAVAPKPAARAKETPPSDLARKALLARLKKMRSGTG